METTWASGAVELLKHADSHINLDSAFDRRIAFISVDNAVETMVRTFLSLPKTKSGIHVGKKLLDDAGNSFPALLELFWNHVGSRLAGIDQADIEHYHRIRNTLYHNGTGLSVDEQYLLAYRQIAAILLKELYGVSFAAPRNEPTLGNLVLLWNRLNQALKQKMDARGVHRGSTFQWEEAIEKKLLTSDDIQHLTELRMIRNKQVHSTDVDNKQVEYAVNLAERLLTKLST